MPEGMMPGTPGQEMPGGASPQAEAQQPEGTGGPAGSPMSSPTKKEGDKTAAKLWVAHVAIPAMEKALTTLGSSSEEGQAILGALKILSKTFGASKQEDIGMNSMVQLLGRKGQRTQ